MHSVNACKPCPSTRQLANTCNLSNQNYPTAHLLFTEIIAKCCLASLDFIPAECVTLGLVVFSNINLFFHYN